MRAVLVVSELALGVALLVCALLMIRTFLTLRPSAPGFDPANKLVALTRLPPDWTDADRRQFVDHVSRQLLATPGVRAVAGTTYIPMSRSIDIRPITIGDVSGNVWTATVTPDYFDLMHIPLASGRGFLDSDDASRSAAIVNEAFVRRWLPGRAPLGSTVVVRLDPKTRFETRIVGVITDTRAMGADTRSRPELYLPFAQLVLGSPYFVIAAAPDTLARVPALLRTIVDRVRPGQLVDRIDAFDAMLATEVSTPRFGAWLFGLFAAVAVALAAIGLTATLSWSVTARRREIGIRMALGASHERVRRWIVWQTLGFAGAGITIGLALAFWATRYIASWLYGVAPTDPATFAACAIGMLAIALVAAYLPARRATRIDPLIALRAE
jgi:predicted permease